MAPDHWINAVITAITKIKPYLSCAYPSTTSAIRTSLLLDPASAALLAVYYAFSLEATRKILKDIIVLVMLNI
jgi:hypothetical protein